MILNNLLPGLREIRAPLIAGYLWLIAAWFALEPLFPDDEPSSGIVASAIALHAAVPPLGVAVASTVVAFLIGSLSEALLAGLWRREKGYGGILFTPPIGPRGIQAMQTVALREAEHISRTLQETGVSLSSALHEPLQSNDIPTVAGLINESRVQVGNATGLPSTVIPERDAVMYMTVVIRTALEEERDLLATRLIGEESELFGSIDRLRAESNLRFEIGPPLIALTFVLLVRSCSLVWLLTLIAVAVLWRQGSVRYRESNDLLFDALFLNRVKSPTVERIRDELELYRQRP
ncbi:MAG TPA: hypothetical protein VFZ19_06050 [Solirubrobacterales bacterium]